MLSLSLAMLARHGRDQVRRQGGAQLDRPIAVTASPTVASQRRRRRVL